MLLLSLFAIIVKLVCDASCDRTCACSSANGYTVAMATVLTRAFEAAAETVNI